MEYDRWYEQEMRAPDGSYIRRLTDCTPQELAKASDAMLWLALLEREAFGTMFGIPAQGTRKTAPSREGRGRKAAAKSARRELMEWQPIETAPKGRSVLLAVAGTFVPIYCGRKRYGVSGEPSQDVLAWRCDSSGRFATPTHWMELPERPPAQDAGLYGQIKRMRRSGQPPGA